MIELSTYIQANMIIEDIHSGCIKINNLNEADVYITNVLHNNIQNVTFKRTFLQTYTLNKLQEYKAVNIVNCNCTLERFCESLNNNTLTIYINLNKCKDQNILQILNNRKGIIVC